MNWIELLPVIGGSLLWFGRYTLLSFASHLVGVWIQKLLVKTEKEAAAWLHFKHKAMHKGVRDRTSV